MRQEGRWTFGRKGDGYVALYSDNPAAFAEDNDNELLAWGQDNVFVIELGRAADNGTFDDFVAAISAAAITAGKDVRYDSPSVGLVEVGWGGPLTVAGERVDLGPFPRWHNEFATVEFGSPVTRMT